jgi:hypothetical protein
VILGTFGVYFGVFIVRSGKISMLLARGGTFGRVLVTMILLSHQRLVTAGATRQVSRESSQEQNIHIELPLPMLLIKSLGHQQQ